MSKRVLPSGITKSAIEAASLGAFISHSPVVIWDNSPKGFFVRIGSPNTKYRTGKVTFGVHKRQGGRGSKAISVMFGTYPEMSIQEARDKAISLLAQIRNGENPSQKRKDLFKERREQNELFKRSKFSIIAEQYRLKRIEENQNGSTNYFDKEMPALFEKYVYPQIGKRAFPEIGKDDLKTLLRAIPTLPMRGKVEAMLKPLFKHALSEDIITANPFDAIEATPKPAPRERVLTPQEIKAFWNATADIIETEKPLFGYFYRVLFLSACRLREISDLEFSEIHIDENKLIIPPIRMKNKKPHWVPITPLMKQTLDQTPKKHKEYVFSYGKSALSGFSMAKNILDERMQAYLKEPLQPFVNHAFRDTFSTIMNSRGENPDHIDLCLSHIPKIKQGVQGKYNHYMYWPERQAIMNKWDNNISELVK